MKILAIFFLTYSTAYCKNLGHRICGDLEGFEDNSIANVMRCSEFQGSKKFKYWETDIRETKDHRLVLNHDNKYYGKSIRGSNLEDLRKITRKDGSHLATVEEFLMDVEQLATKPIMLEVKELHSDKARDKYIKTRSNYRSLKIEFLAFPKAFKKSFPDKKFWCSKLKVVKRARKHSTNLCD
jgi:glycerophosphoryl diester phosphodiesterase